MKLLLDTHIFIWLHQSPLMLPRKTLEYCLDRENSLYLSVASIWEMQIKRQLGKLQLNTSIRNMVTYHQRTNDLHILPVEMEHILGVEALPFHHKDPFDRLLIAQSIHEDLRLVSVDSIFEKYGINTPF